MYVHNMIPRFVKPGAMNSSMISLILDGDSTTNGQVQACKALSRAWATYTQRLGFDNTLLAT